MDIVADEEVEALWMPRPEMPLRLAQLFGNSEAFWLNLQRAVDLHEAHAAIGTEVRRIAPLRLG
jgi:plasmid maintenance system antidote protein VapI